MTVILQSKLILTIFLSMVLFVNSYPVKDMVDILAYLKRFGYIESTDGTFQFRVANNKVREGMKRFQYFAGIPTTGVLDQSTMRAMNLPRCGNVEVLDPKSRQKRYVLDSKWEKTFLTYRVLNYPNIGIPKNIVEREVDLAFEYWTNATNIHVKRSVGPGPADLEISFVTGAHNDGIEFDNVAGVGRVIAHAWKPFNEQPLRGDMHFNDEVTWTSGPGSGESIGFDFLRTAVHEAGHALGLEHSPHPDAIMYFAVSGHQPDLSLSKDDLAGIKELYGKKGGIEVNLRGPAGLTPGKTKEKPVIVPSGTPDQNTPWECYRLQEERPKDTKAIKTCYQGFYKDFYLRTSEG